MAGGKNLEEVISEIVSNRRIGDQFELQTALAERGHAVSQATLSRHLRRLKIRKVNGYYQWRAVAPVEGGPRLTIVPCPPNLVVLRTQPGYGQFLALRLDRAVVPEILGTVAGDDTVFVAVMQSADLEDLVGRIEEILA